MGIENNNNKGYVLVTGGTSGIGFELAKCFARAGYNLAIVARSEEGLEEAADHLEAFGGQVKTFSIDLVIPGAAKELTEEISTSGITIEILVNDAGQGLWGKFTDTDLDREIDLVHLNIISLMSLTKYYLKEMADRGSGKILQLASSLSKVPSPYLSVYAATKAFVYSFTEALVQEMKGTGVTLTALLPGATDTDFFHKARAEDTVIYKETDLYDPAEVAKAGFEGLMAGKDKVIPGPMNKMQGIMSNVMTDKMAAGNIKKQMEPSEKDGGRFSIGHERSAAERERINKETGGFDGDFEEHSGHVHEDK